MSEPIVGDAEVTAVVDCLRSGWISSSGEHLATFESRWAAYCGRRYGIAVSNGTAALQLAVAALDLRPGDEVILPSFTIVSCALAVVYAGATPVLVDADPETWCMDVGQLRERLTPRTRAIMPVHMYGHPVDMDPLLELAADHGVAVIEDAAEAHGAEYRGRRCGSFGELSTFSFYANKPVTTGEGGMVVTDDERLAARCRSLRNLGFGQERRFEHRELAFNFRMTNLQAAIGVAQLARLEGILESKRANAARYRARLAGIPGLQLPVEREWARSIYWMFGVVLPDSGALNAAAVIAALAERGIEARPFFLGMHRQPAFVDRGLFRGERYPVTDRLGERGLYLPSGPRLTEDQIDEVTDTLRAVIG